MFDIAHFLDIVIIELTGFAQFDKNRAASTANDACLSNRSKKLFPFGIKPNTVIPSSYNKKDFIKGDTKDCLLIYYDNLNNQYKMR
jgi:hypothetical protein